MTYSELLLHLQHALQADRPMLLVLAGSNGAGKTTFYELYLERFELPFVNADRIAQLVDPMNPSRVAYHAATLAAEARQTLIDQRRSFCMGFERTRRNIHTALQFVDVGILIDNSSVDRPFRIADIWVAGIRQGP